MFFTVQPYFKCLAIWKDIAAEYLLTQQFEAEHLLTQQFDLCVHATVLHVSFAMNVDVFFPAFKTMTVLIKKFFYHSSTFLSLISHRIKKQEKKKKDESSC